MLLSGRETSLQRYLYDPKTIRKIATDAFNGTGAQLFPQNLLEPESTVFQGQVIFNGYKLKVHTTSAELISGFLVLLICLTVVVLLPVSPSHRLRVAPC
jgi:hypothetical protein